jgi:hypothetical protein
MAERLTESTEYFSEPGVPDFTASESYPTEAALSFSPKDP